MDAKIAERSIAKSAFADSALGEDGGGKDPRSAISQATCFTSRIFHSRLIAACGSLGGGKKASNATAMKGMISEVLAQEGLV